MEQPQNYQAKMYYNHRISRNVLDSNSYYSMLAIYKENQSLHNIVYSISINYLCMTQYELLCNII